ncbi:ABC transporter substrate-binding protein [Roseateles sp.]|uniref:ABC transporter substrate-binding protein n=1 Tax=Roseateles sp. TaxID=1971397 RepID=UPI003265C2DA
MDSTLNRRSFVAAGVGTALPLARAAEPTRLAYGYSAVTDFATVFVAAEHGMFARQGLDVDLRFIPLNPTILPAVQSGSLQMGGPTPTAYLQAVSGGLDQVVVGGGGALSKTFTEVGLVTKPGAGITSAADCAGRKIAVPGLGALLHVVFRQWLKMSHVDQSKVSFVEAPFPQHADLLRAGTVDAVVTAGPFMARMLASGEAKVAAYFSTFLPDGPPTVVHIATREWALKNPAAVKGFRSAIGEAAQFIAKPGNEAAVRAALGKYLKLPAPVAQAMQISPPAPVVTAKHLQYWGQLMREQGYLKSEPDYASLIAKA